MADPIEVPPSWRDDPLCRFFHDAYGNTLAGFAQFGSEFNRLASVHVAFQKVIDTGIADHEIPLRLFVCRAHAAYLGGCMLSLSGLLPEAHMVLRGCLEAALYGCHIGEDRDRFVIWVDRGKDDLARKRVRREFCFENLMGSLRGRDEGTCDIARELYERLIDYGGHPNEMSVMSQLTRGEKERFNFVCLMTGQDPQYTLCLKTTAQVGVCALEVFRHTDPACFDALGLCGEIDALKADL